MKRSTKRRRPQSSKRISRRLLGESLERRDLLAVDPVSGIIFDFDAGLMNITGTAGDDTIEVAMPSGGNLLIQVNGAAAIDSGQTSASVTSLRIDGRDGNDTLRILSGDVAATLVGGNGNDTLDAAALATASASLHGQADNDILIGGRARDIMQGGPGIDTNIGGTGDDFIIIDVSADIVMGGGGSDRVEARTATEAISIDMGASEVEFFSGSAFDDVVTAATSPSGVTILGRGGNDMLTGSEFDDVIEGGNGADALVGLGGRDVLNGQQDIDTFSGGNGDDALFVDAADLGPGLLGGAGFDQITVLDVNGANLIISDANGIEKMIGGSGNDVFDASATTVGIIMEGNDGNDTFTGGSGNDALRGEDGDDVLNGGAGDDSIEGGVGADMINLGAGPGEVNTLRYHQSPAAVDLDFVNFTANGGDATGDMIAPFMGSILVYLTPHDDFVVAGPTSERFIGNGGIDVVDYSNSPAGINIRLDGQQGSGGFAALDQVVGFSDVIGSDFGDTIVGNALDNLLEGGDGDDIISGGGGSDFLIGDDGNDLISGDAGDDTILGGNDDDFLIGGSGSDLIDGESGDDRLQGGAEADLLNGGDNDDRVFGDELDFLLSGGMGDDELYLRDASVGVAIDVSFLEFERVFGSSFGDTITNQNSAEDIEIYGLGGDDELTGGDGEDLIFGGDGDDTVRGSIAPDLEIDRVDGDGDNDVGDVELGVDLALDLEVVNPL